MSEVAPLFFTGPNLKDNQQVRVHDREHAGLPLYLSHQLLVGIPRGYLEWLHVAGPSCMD